MAIEQTTNEIISYIERFAVSYSDKMLYGTRLGIAIMRTLGFFRDEYSVTTPAAKDGKGGWDPTRIHIKTSNKKKLYAKVIKYRDVFVGCGFDVNIYVHDGKLFMIGITRAWNSAKVQLIFQKKGMETIWKTI